MPLAFTYRRRYFGAVLLLLAAMVGSLHGQTDLERLAKAYEARDREAKSYGFEEWPWNLDSIVQDRSWTPSIILWRGERMMDAGRLGRARYLMSRIVEEHPNTTHATAALLQQGLIALEEKAYGKARIHFDEAIIKGTADGNEEGAIIAGTALYLIAYTQAVEAEQPLESSIVLLEELLMQYPDHPREADALYMLGEIAEIKGQHERALEYYDRVIRNRGSEPRFEARNHRAQCLAHLGRYHEAQAELESVQSDLDRLWYAGTPVWNQEEMHADCMLLRGELEIVLGNYSAAEYAFVRLMNSGQHYRRKGLLGLADTYYAAGRNDSASAIYTRIIAEDSSDAAHERAEFSRGLVLRAIGREEESVKVFETIGADSLHRMNDRALVELALIRYRAQNYGAASQVLSRVITTTTNEQTRVRAYIIKGAAELGGGEPSRAIESFEAAEKISAGNRSYKGPELAEARLLSGITLARTNRSSEAITTLNRFIAQYPGHSSRDEAMLWLGESYYHSGLYKAAIDVMEDLIEQFPGSMRVPDAMYTTGWANFRQRQFEAAEAAFAQLVKAYPSSPYVAEAQLRRGDALYIAGRYDDAARAYRQVERLRPSLEESTYATYQEAVAHLKLGRLDDADTLLQRFAECYGAMELAEDAAFHRAEIAMSRGESRRAIDLLGNVIGASSQESLLPSAYEELAQASLKLGNQRMAAGAYSIILERFPKSSIAQQARQRLDGMMSSRDDAPVSTGGNCGDANIWLAMGRADVYQKAYRPDDAILEYRAIAGSQGECTQDIWLGLAESHIAAGRAAQAIDTLRLMLGRFPDGRTAPAALALLGRAHLMQRDTVAGIKALEQLRSAYPDSTESIDARILLSTLYARQGGRDTAVAILYENLSRFPAGARKSWLGLARLDTVSMRRDTVRQNLDQLAEHDDSLGTEALFTLAGLAMAEGRSQDAMTAYENIAGRHERDSRTTYRALIAAGQLYEKLGETEKARESYERILRKSCDENLRKQAEEHIQALRKL